MLVDASGERLVNGDSLVPPTARTLSSSAIKSASDMPSEECGNTWVSARLPASEGGGTFFDPANAEVTDVAIGIAVVFGEEDVDETVDII